MEVLETEIYRYYQTRMNLVPHLPETQSISPAALIQKYDAFFFDAFGTLYNREHYVYPGALAFFRLLRKGKKHIRLITNSASRVPKLMLSDLHEMGFDFIESEILSSGNLFAEETKKDSFVEAFYLGRPRGKAFAEAAGVKICKNPKNPVVIVSSKNQDPQMTAHATEILKRPGSCLWVLNPDAWAPFADGTREPVSGACAHTLKKVTNCRTEYCGKPFPLIFKKALQSLPIKAKAVMIGDTLGTDIAGAFGAGIDSALIPGRNMELKKLSADEALLGLRPTYYLNFQT